MWGTLLKNLLSEGRILHLFKLAQAALLIRLEPKENLKQATEGSTGIFPAERRNIWERSNRTKELSPYQQAERRLRTNKKQSAAKKMGPPKRGGPGKMGVPIGLDC